MRRIREPHAVDRNITGQGIGRSSCGFNAPFGVFSCEAAHQSHSRRERNIPNAESDQPVAHVSRQLPLTSGADGFRAYRFGHIHL
jgi:hypothetical protein